MSTSRDTRRQMYEQLVGRDVARGRFVITRLLGFGGMGAVYEALQPNMNRHVALKLIPTHDPTTVARFEREALTISQLRHPNTITVFDNGRTDDGFLFLSMELLRGHSLSDVIKANGPLPPRRAVHIASQICRSLNEAHTAGIVHRDIKPDNILLITVDSDDSFVKVLDFGIAKAVMGEDDVQLTGDGRIIGTPRYMSPEQILADPIDHRSDIYSLGCIIFEMLTGAPPFQQSSTTALMISHTQDPPPAFAQRLAPPSLEKIPPYLEGVVRRALAKDPNERQQSCEILRRELEEAMGAVPVGQSMQYLQASAPPATSSHSGMLVSPQTGNFAQRPMTGNFAQPPVTGTFNPPMQSAPQPPPPAAADAPEAASRTPLIAIGVLLVVIVSLSTVAVLRPPAETPQPPADVVDSPSQEEAPSTPPDEKPETPKFVSIEVSTDPPGARVFKDGADANLTTPGMMALPLGQPVQLTLKKDGYLDYQASVVPTEAKPLAVKLVAKVKEKGSNGGSKTSGPVKNPTRPKDPRGKDPRPDTKPPETTNNGPKNTVERIDDDDTPVIPRLDE